VSHTHQAATQGGCSMGTQQRPDRHIPERCNPHSSVMDSDNVRRLQA
jgi:hypothetical protein